MDATVQVDKAGRKQAVDPCDEPCAIERGMRLIGGKWKGSVLWHLQDGPVQFNDLVRMLPAAGRRMIAQRLRELQEDRLITRHEMPDDPRGGVTYSVTPLGRRALAVLDELRDWVDTDLT